MIKPVILTNEDLVNAYVDTSEALGQCNADKAAIRGITVDLEEGKAKVKVPF